MARWFRRSTSARDPWTPKEPPLGYISDMMCGVPMSASISKTSDGRTLVSAPVGLFTNEALGTLAEMADKSGETLTFWNKS